MQIKTNVQKSVESGGECKAIVVKTNANQTYNADNVVCDIGLIRIQKNIKRENRAGEKNFSLSKTFTHIFLALFCFF